MELLKKIFQILSALPAFSNLFKMAAQTGKIDPYETLSALTSLSPSTKKMADDALNKAQNGQPFSDIANSIMQTGEVEVMGQKLDTRTMVDDLEKAGGICKTISNILRTLPKQPVQDVADFGRAASEIKNWKEIVT